MKFQYIDIHAHVNFAAFDADREAAIAQAHEAGVAIVNVGTQKDTSRSAVELAEKYESGVYAIIGLHPTHTAPSFQDKDEIESAYQDELATAVSADETEFDYDFYKKLAMHPKVVAIGECGLDYFRMEIQDSLLRDTTGGQAGFKNKIKKQEEVFRKHIELAIEVGKPLMLHLRSGNGRSAYDDAYDILEPYLKANPLLKADLHFFAGTYEEARPFLDAGCSLSFTGVITFARNYDDVIRMVPLDRIMAETDCPYVAPAPYRGKRNEPAYVVEVVKKIAAIRCEDEEKVRAQILQNANTFFSLPN